MKTVFIIDIEPTEEIDDIYHLTKVGHLDFMPFPEAPFVLCPDWDPVTPNKHNPPAYHFEDDSIRIVFNLFFPRSVIDDRIEDLIHSGFLLEGRNFRDI